MKIIICIALCALFSVLTRAEAPTEITAKDYVSGVRILTLEIEASKVTIDYKNTGNPTIGGRENYIKIKSTSNNNRNVSIAIEARETEDLFWNGRVFEVYLQPEIRVALFVLKDSWDGENPRPMDLLIFSDGKKIETIRPEKENLNYDDEIRRIGVLFGLKTHNSLKRWAEQINAARKCSK
jgi:hypothetical protein